MLVSAPECGLFAARVGSRHSLFDSEVPESRDQSNHFNHFRYSHYVKSIDDQSKKKEKEKKIV